MKEYGGYLSLELCKGEEYYRGLEVLRCNCGRTAIVLAIRDAGYKKILLPYYMCQSVEQELKKQNIDIGYYHIAQDYNPIKVNLDSEEGILIADYFGTKSRKDMIDLVKKYKRVILDHTQSFFMHPVSGAYNIYSCRKFFGVADGAYLIKEGFKEIELKPMESSMYAGFLLKSIETGTNDNYRDSLINEKRIEDSGICGMSVLTKRILEGVNYESVRTQRRKNFQYMHELLGGVNQWKGTLENEMVPMVYPFLYEDSGLRDYLISKNIYVPQWWKYLLEESKGNEFELWLCKYLIPLPIDQRYLREDMDAIVRQITHYIDGHRKG